MKPKLIAALGGALLVVGSLLPWATLSVGAITRSFVGTDGDGIITLVIGAVITLAGISGSDKPAARASLIAAVLGLIGFFIMVYKILMLSSTVSDSNSALLHASLGIGLWVCALGSVFAFSGGLMRNPADQIQTQTQQPTQ